LSATSGRRPGPLYKGDYDTALWTQLVKIKGPNGEPDYYKIARAILTGGIVIDAPVGAQQEDPHSVRAAARRIGRALENECWYFGLYVYGIIRVGIPFGLGVPRGRTLAARVKAGRKTAAEIGYHEPYWSPEKRARAGGWGIYMLETYLPDIFRRRMAYVSQGKTEWWLEVTDKGRDILEAAFDDLVKNNPHISPPRSSRPWTSFRCGGFWDRPLRLVNRGGGATEEEMQAAIDSGQMQPALDALDYLQSVGFRINGSLLQFVKWAWEKRCKLEGLPEFGKRGFGGAKSAFEINLGTGDQMLQQGRFVCPLRFDFRGRIYPATQFNILGNSAIRSLFLFADGEETNEAGAAQALPMLLQYVASCRGARGTFIAKVQWTAGDRAFAAWAADAALDREQWPALVQRLEQEKIKDPFPFLAGCLELARLNAALATGSKYTARLPLFLDFTSSGPQHLCLMSRDEFGGARVNLVPADAPRDLYTETGESLLPELERVAASRNPVRVKGMGDVRPLARSILKRGWTAREFGKPVIMPWGYGISKGAATKALRDAGVEHDAAPYLRMLLFDAIPQMLPRAVEIKDWLTAASLKLSAAGKHLRWTAPDGFPLVNRYLDPDVKVIPLLGHRRHYTIKETVGDLTTINDDDARKGAAPNVVHAVDAALLRAVAREAARHKIPLVTLHDCFAVPATSARWMHSTILRLLAELHQEHDILAEVAKHSGGRLPRRPSKGKLDVSLVPTCMFALSS